MEATIRRRSSIGKPSSRIKAADRKSGHRPADRQIVHGAVYREPADIPSGKE